MTRWWFPLGCALIVAGLGWWALRVSLLPDTEQGAAAGYGHFLLDAAGLVISLIALRPAVASRTGPPVADRLATAMRNQWKFAAERLLLSPSPLPVRWRRATDPVAGPTAAATLTRADAPLPPLRGWDRVTASRLRTGGGRDLHRIYGGLASGRLLIIGGAGIPFRLLRTVGPVYQFRHATLQDRLALQTPDRRLRRVVGAGRAGRDGVA